jgi:hypothetical protein
MKRLELQTDTFCRHHLQNVLYCLEVSDKNEIPTFCNCIMQDYMQAGLMVQGKQNGHSHGND